MKNLTPHGFSVLASLALLITSCSSGDDPVTPVETPNNNPGIFSANTTEIGFDAATIEWTESLDFDDDPVTYAVYLEGTEISKSITSLTYSFTGLESETNYSGYVESRDGKGGTNKADFFFTTEPELIIQTIDVSIVERTEGTSFNIDAVFVIEPVENAKSYTIEILEMNPDSSPTRIGIQYTWDPLTDALPILVNDQGNYVFYFDYGAGLNIANTAGIAQARAYYANVTGSARVFITVGN